MKTVAIYQQTENGILRLGTFTPRKYYSVRAISEQFCYKHPNADPKTLLIAPRMAAMGRTVDSAERIPFDCGTYRVIWHNNEACGALPGTFHSERTAEEYGRNWRREMIAIEPTARDRKAAAAEYTYEVEEIESEEELDPEAAPDNPRPEWY